VLLLATESLSGQTSKMNEPWAKKSLGQHWLHDMATLEAMAEDVQPGDTVLEIGPGTGTLTEVLLKKGAQVVAVEKDNELVSSLLNIFADRLKHLTLVNQSILEFDLTTLPPGYKVVANIPYYLTSNLIRVLSESTNPPVSAVLLVQKEVAERVVAAPGKMSLLSVSAQYYWEVTLGRDVPARLFTPPPKVDSQILKLNYRANPLFKDVNSKDFFRIVKAGFGERRKTLENSLSGGLRLSKDETKNILKKAGIDPGLRAQALSLEEWHNIHTSLHS
jgi:16S rRNA (adenine1518-N6/adenine1519-N6)-dimethyltransferase